MAQYENYAVQPTFNIPVPVDTTTKAKKKYQEELSQMKEFFASNRIVDQQRIEDTKFVGKPLEALAGLIKSGGELTAKVGMQTAKDKAIGALRDAAIDPNTEISAEENQAFEFGARAKGATKLATGIANETAFLTDVGATLDAQTNALLQSDYRVNYKGKSYPLFQLAQNPETAALAVDFALSHIYAKRGVDYATKAGFVKILAPIHKQVIANRTSNLISQANSRQQRSNAAAVLQNASAAGASLITFAQSNVVSTEDFQAKVAETYLQQTNDALKFNTNLTPSEINVSVLKSMLASSGRNPALRDALETTVLPGNKQNLIDLYPQVFAEAEKTQKAEQKSFDQEQATTLMTEGLQKLQAGIDSGMISLDDAREQVNELYPQILNLDVGIAGTFSSQATRLINRTEEQDYNSAVRLIESGGEMSVETINGMGLNPTRTDDLLNRLDTRTEVKSIVGSSLTKQMGTLRRNALTKAGFGLDSLEQLTEKEGWFGDPATIEVALGNMENDILRTLEAYARTEEYKNLDPAGRAQALDKRRLELYQDLIKEGNDYQAIGYLLKGPKTEREQSIIRREFNKYASPDKISPLRQTNKELKNLTSYWSPGNPASTNVQQRWQAAGGVRGDARILSFDEIQAYAREYNDTGVWPNGLQVLATSLGTNPRALWIQQAQNTKIPSTYENVERVQLKDKVDPQFNGAAQPGPELSQAERRSIGYQTSQWMINAGMSENAAKAGYEIFAATSFNEWENLLKEMKQDASLWSVLSDPRKSARQNLTALMIWETQRNEQQ